MTGQDPFVVAVKTLAFRLRKTKKHLETSAERVATHIRRYIDQGTNAGPYVAKDAPRVVGSMTPLSKATLDIREQDGIVSKEPYKATGHTRAHIGGHHGTATQIRVGGTDLKAQRCILLNYGTDNVPAAAMGQVRSKLGSRMPNTDIPARNPIGYTKETADAIFRFWHELFLVDDKTHSRSEITITLF